MDNTPLEAPPAHRPTESGRRVPRYLVTGYVLATFGLNMALLTPIASTLALKIAEVAPGQKETALGLITGLGAIVALVTSPVAGAISDRTTWRWGMRRPWIVLGAMVGLLALAGIGVAPTVVIVAVGWVIASLGLNFAMAGLYAWIPDQVPEVQRGRVAGLTDMAQQTSAIFGIIIARVALTTGLGTVGTFLVPGAIGFALLILFAIIMKDRVLSPNLREPLRIDVLWRAFSFSPRQHPNFGLAFLSRFLVMFAFAFFTTYQVFFMMDRLHLNSEEVLGLQAGLGALSVLVISASASISGFLSDRLRRRRLFVYISTALLAVGMTMWAFTTSIEMLFVSVVVIGVSIGIYFAVSLALAVDVVPDRAGQAGRYMGVFNISTALPQALAPAIAPLILAVGSGSNYTLLFLVGAAASLVGGATTMLLRNVR
jgi:MFS family permease